MTGFWFAIIFLVQSQIPVQVEPGTVTGRLLTRNGEPEAGVRIAAVPAASGDGQTNAAALFGISQTDAEGRYRLDNLPPGRYYIFAGLIDLPSYYPNATTLDRATAIDVDAGSTVSGIDFSMARPTKLTVSGRLSLPSTIPPSDSWIVTMTPLSRNAIGVFTQSKVGRDGLFEFPRVSPGEYRVTSNAPGSTSLIVRVVDADVVDVVVPVFDCNAGVQVSGRVVGPSQTSIRSISLTGSPVGCRPSTSVETDGSFFFKNVPIGGYQFQLSPSPLGWIGVALTVDKQNLTGVIVQLPDLIEIKGRAFVEDGSALPRTLRGAPIPVQATRSPTGDTSASIQEDGTFELLLPKGRYRFSIPGVPPGYYVKEFTAGPADLSNSNYIVDDTPPEEIHMTLGVVRRQPQGVRLTGHLSLATAGDLLEAESVLLVSSGNRNAVVRESAVAADGSFEFAGIPPGIYNLETYPDSPAALYGIVVENTDVTGIEFVLPVLIKVKGGIEWADSGGGTIVPAKPSVSVQFTRKEGDRLLAWGTLALAGSFHFYLPEGDYRFSVSDLPPNFNVGSVTAGDANVLETGLRIRSDSSPADLRVTLRGK